MAHLCRKTIMQQAHGESGGSSEDHSTEMALLKNRLRLREPVWGLSQG